MTILITGPTGGTGRALATLVSQSSHPFLLAMRRPEKAPPGMSASRFDWSDESTYAKPFEDANAKGKPVTAVYLIAPTGAPDPGALMTRFIDQAVDKHGVKRFVFCGGGSLRVDGPYLGEFLRHVLNLVENKGLEWCLLRATWFDGTLRLTSIRRTRVCCKKKKKKEGIIDAAQKTSPIPPGSSRPPSAKSPGSTRRPKTGNPISSRRGILRAWRCAR